MDRGILMQKKSLSLLIAAALMGAMAPAFAITDDEVNSSIQFSFVPPGARALGFGGAFSGLADDATAAYSNPAGLTQLAAPEISLEGRRVGYESEYVDGGSFNFPAADLDLSGIDYSRSDETVNGLSFLSYVYPKDNWAIAVYRHEFVNYTNEYATSGVDAVINGRNIPDALRPYAAEIDLDIVNWGISGAYKFTDQLSLGLSLIYSDFEIESTNVRFEGTTPIFLTSQDGDDDGFGVNLGLLWKFNERWQLGAVYRRAPTFDYDASNFTAAGVRAGFPRRTEFNAPDVFGLGIVFRPADLWTVSLDINRVSYSQISDDLRSGFDTDDSDLINSVGPLKIDDGTEIRLGTEYVFANFTYPISLRAGVWRDPEHTLTFQGRTPSSLTNALANEVLFSTGDDETHGSLGFGIVFPRFQIDAAFDFSDSYDSFSLSGVYRFQ
jgi:long-subunit fatty acid transport protein